MVKMNPNNHGQIIGKVMKIDTYETKNGGTISAYRVRVNNPAECKTKYDDVLFKVFGDAFKDTVKVGDNIIAFTYSKINRFGKREYNETYCNYISLIPNNEIAETEE